MNILGSLAEHCPLRRRPGKLEAIIQAGGEVFMEQGYEAASMDAIVARAGVSKSTVYSYFKSKEDLFAAVIRSECRFFEDAESTQLGMQDVRADLLTLGRRFLSIVFSAKAIAAYRIVVAEAQRFPDLGRVFFESGPMVVTHAIEDYLKTAAAKGWLSVPDPDHAAWHFNELLRGKLHLRLILGVDQTVDPTELEHHIADAADIMMRCYAPMKA